MKIYDCFMFFDEEMLLDLRLNILDKYVDKFVITEANYMHSGKPKKLIFDINKYSKFKDKIIYHVVDNKPSNLENINETDTEKVKAEKQINNSNKREHYQRDFAINSLKRAEPDDFIIINDLDEIPNLHEINFKKINNKLIYFKQKMFYYKFNLLHENLLWIGSRACKKKYFISPQWLRDTKEKKYPFWRFDTILSKKKYTNIHYVENGGWHFTNIKLPEEIEKKYLNFLHHYEYEKSGIKLENLKEIIKNKKILYDHSADKRDFKWKNTTTLKKVSLSILPDYISENQEKYANWLESN